MNRSEVYKILTSGQIHKKDECEDLCIGSHGMYMTGGIISVSGLKDAETDKKPSHLQNQTFLSNI